MDRAVPLARTAHHDWTSVQYIFSLTAMHYVVIGRMVSEKMYFNGCSANMLMHLFVDNGSSPKFDRSVVNACYIFVHR